MNDKTRDNRGLWDAGALAVAAAVTVLATACGGGSAPPAASTAAHTLLPPGAHVSVDTTTAAS